MASSEIEEFNWNLRHFLDVLAKYQTHVNKANPATIQLLEQTVDKLGNLFENVEETDEGQNETITLSIDDSKFDIKRSIFCRMCEVEFGATRTEYIFHSADAKHNRKLIEHMNKSDNNNNKKVEGCNGMGSKVQTDVNASSNDAKQTKPLHDSNASKDDQSAYKNDVMIDRERKLSNSLQHQSHIPNVFEDDIFEFLNSIDNNANNQSGTKVVNGLNKESQKAKTTETGTIPKNSWRNSSKGDTHTARVDQWRQNSVDTDLSKQNAPPKLQYPVRVPSTHDIIQSGAAYTGTGIRPCPTYELNNMYLKFPYLNSEKVPNPLKPAHSHKTSPNDTSNAPTGFNKMNRQRSTDFHERNNLSSSSASRKNALGRRYSSSSTDLPSVAKTNDSANQRKNMGGVIPKQLNKSPNSPEEVPVALIDSQKLEKFFSNDLSSLIHFTINVNSRPEKIVTQKKLIESIEHLLKPKFTTVKGHLIGSHAYNIAKGGLATVDFYLDLHKSFCADKAGSVFIEGMDETRKLMEKCAEWSNIECSERSRYAILSADHVGCKRKCHFAFGTGVAVKNTEIVNSFFAAQPVAQQVVICIRLALQEGSKDEWTRHFSGYVITLLVIFYFQIKKKLPSVASLQKDVHPVIKCGENPVHFKNPSVAICKDRVRDLLLGFFGYYKDFDFANKIISPFEGREIYKDFRNEDSMSHSINRFQKFLHIESKRWTIDHMCVQDTFEHKRNVTYQIEGYHMTAFKDFCAKSYHIIEAVGPSVKY